MRAQTCLFAAALGFAGACSDPQCPAGELKIGATCYPSPDAGASEEDPETDDDAEADAGTDPTAAMSCLADEDRDGYGPVASRATCPIGKVPPMTGDCDDRDSRAHPDLPESCGDGIDNDCNPATPDACGTSGCKDAACATPDASLSPVDAGTDAGPPAMKPPVTVMPCVAAAESCDGKDNDCDGVVDEGVKNACGSCGPIPPEVCDGKDNNCNGLIDEGTEAGKEVMWQHPEDFGLCALKARIACGSAGFYYKLNADERGKCERCGGWSDCPKQCPPAPSQALACY